MGVFLFRREKLKRNIPTAEEINTRFIQENETDGPVKSDNTKQKAKAEDLHYSSEESGSDAVMRRFLGKKES